MTEDSAARAQAVRDVETEVGDIVARFRQLMAESAQRLHPGMLPAAYKVFTTIARRGTVTPSALADHLMMDRGQLSRALRELDDLDLITRSADPVDKRCSILSPTPEGLARLAAARAPYDSMIEAALADWKVDDIRSLARLLRALATPA